MTTLPQGPESQRGLDALTDLYRDGLERPDRAELNRGLVGVRTRMGVRKTRQRRMLRWSLAGAGATLALLIIARLTLVPWTVPQPPSPVLTYQIEGGSLLKGGYLRETGHSGIKLRFNEGSEVAFAPGARGRVRSVDKEGARVAVDHGKASFQVHKAEGRRWLVEVGPFLVTVKGTIFTTSWDPLGERFELRLRQGHVSVSGPASTGDINLESGQRLVVNLARAETVISEEKTSEGDGDLAGAPAAQATKAVAAPPSSVTSPRPAPSLAPKPSLAPVSESRSGSRWAEDFANGRWDRILKDAEQSGVEATLKKGSMDDLFVLADAARYRQRPDLARAALLAERRRFPDSPRTLSASFLLGRVEESREGGRSQAISWYDEYLSRAPTGTLAAEALGRKMMLTAEIHGPTRARPLADEYLRRFPQGSYARSAHLLQTQPATSAP